MWWVRKLGKPNLQTEMVEIDVYKRTVEGLLYHMLYHICSTLQSDADVLSKMMGGMLSPILWLSEARGWT